VCQGSSQAAWPNDCFDSSSGIRQRARRPQALRVGLKRCLQLTAGLAVEFRRKVQVGTRLAINRDDRGADVLPLGLAPVRGVSLPGGFVPCCLAYQYRIMLGAIGTVMRSGRQPCGCTQSVHERPEFHLIHRFRIRAVRM
jgi:hypothetical protein